MRRTVPPELPPTRTTSPTSSGSTWWTRTVPASGVVRDVLPGPANDVLELDTGVLLPLVEECVREVDIERTPRPSQSRLHRLTATGSASCASMSSRSFLTPSVDPRAPPLAAVLGSELELRSSTTATPRRSARARSTTNRTAEARAWCCASTWSPRHSMRRTARGPTTRRRALPAGAPARPGARGGARRGAGPHALSARFEGFDQRILADLCTDVISIGPYVLSGGEIPALVLLDAIARRLPGALSEGSGEHESFSRRARRRARVPALHASRGVPRLGVPVLLLSGDHGRRSSAGGATSHVRASAERRRRARPVARPDVSTPPTRATARASDPPVSTDDGQMPRASTAASAGSAVLGPSSPQAPSEPQCRGTTHQPARSVTGRLPDRIRIAVDWVVTIVGAIAIVLLDQGLGRQPVQDPVLVDGADAPLRAARARLRGALLRPRAREPLHLPLPRSASRRDHRLRHAAGRKR